MKSGLLVALLWTLSAIGVGAGARTLSQEIRYPIPPAPEVIAGPEVGFRVYDYRRTPAGNAVPVGELVITRDGHWVAIEFGAAIKPAR